MRTLTPRFTDAAGSPLVEDADAMPYHILDIRKGRTPATSPALGVDIATFGDHARVFLWLNGRPFAHLRTAGNA